MLDRLKSEPGPFDILIIGGGATGVGIAIDSASRGYRTLLLEAGDFGKGTSSRSTKLVHGGVRYLEQGNISLVKHALRERAVLRRNASHLVSELPFAIPSYHWWERPYYGVGLKFYSLLAGEERFGETRILSREQTIERVPTVNPEGLRGGVLYCDGQFDDARLLIHMAATAAEQGAIVLNYLRVTGLTKNGHGRLDGVLARDDETGETFSPRAKVVINATGPFTDFIRKLADPEAAPIVSPSQGVHIVLDRSFLPGDCALMIPRVEKGRVLFAIPWLEHTVVGTTDTAIPCVVEEPSAAKREVEFLLDRAGKYLKNKPLRSDILSIFVGIRPLVKAPNRRNTAQLSRDHVILTDDSGLLTITGGKWTTYRQMAEDCVNRAAALEKLPARPCVTQSLRIHGAQSPKPELGHLGSFGTDAEFVRKLVAADPELATPLSPSLPYLEAEVVWATRHEMARTVEDVLCRRTRSLFLNARAAMDCAPRVARIMASELGQNAEWQQAQLEELRKTAAHFTTQDATA